MNPVSRADVGVIPLWAVPTPVRREGAQATGEGKPCFNRALTPLPPPLQTRMCPFQCRAGQGGWTCVQLAAGTRGVGPAQEWDAAPWTLARKVPLSMDFPNENTEVGCHFLLQETFPT